MTLSENVRLVKVVGSRKILVAIVSLTIEDAETRLARLARDGLTIASMIAPDGSAVARLNGLE